MKKTYALIIALFALSTLSAYAQKTTTLEYSRKRTYTTSTRTVNYWYQGEVNIGYDVNNKMNWKTVSGKSSSKGSDKTDFSQPFLSTIHGVRITKWAFVGLGVGVHYAYGYQDPDDKDDSRTWDTLLLPVFFNAKGYYPIKDNLSVYVTLSFGGSPVLTGSQNYNDYRLTGGYYGEYGVGLNYRKLNFSLGLQQQGMKYVNTNIDDWCTHYTANSFYAKIGLVF